MIFPPVGRPMKVSASFGVVQQGRAWFVTEIVTMGGLYIELPEAYGTEEDARRAAGKWAKRYGETILPFALPPS